MPCCRPVRSAGDPRDASCQGTGGGGSGRRRRRGGNPQPAQCSERSAPLPSTAVSTGPLDCCEHRRAEDEEEAHTRRCGPTRRILSGGRQFRAGAAWARRASGRVAARRGSGRGPPLLPHAKRGVLISGVSVDRASKGVVIRRDRGAVRARRGKGRARDAPWYLALILPSLPDSSWAGPS